jgi:hypothetical protein
VLRGLGSKIQGIKALQIEMSVSPIYESATNSYFAAIAYLQQMGFQLSGVFPVTFDSVNGCCLVEFDCVMCRLATWIQAIMWREKSSRITDR